MKKIDIIKIKNKYKYNTEIKRGVIANMKWILYSSDLLLAPKKYIRIIKISNDNYICLKLNDSIVIKDRNIVFESF